MTDPLAVMGGNLKLTLQALVPLKILELADTSDEEHYKVSRGAARTIAEHGDDLMFGGRHRPDALNALVRALAVLAHQPGGVTYEGLHFCTNHHECQAANAETAQAVTA